MSHIKNAEEISIMREGGRRLAAMLDTLEQLVGAGVKPTDISAKAKELIKKAGMQAVVLGYDGFSDVMCISVNDVIVHGTPQKTPLTDGDVVKLDLTLGYKSLVTDSARTIIVGDGTAEARKLVSGTKQSLEAGIAAIRGEGTRVGDISAAVQDVLDRHGLATIRDLVGHGIGYKIHEDPNIPNYGVSGTGPVLHEGMTICIEPMAALGDWPVNMKKDGTVVMRDGSLGAHFEHTVLITKGGAEILTQS